jgi:hypothetical protein
MAARLLRSGPFRAGALKAAAARPLGAEAAAAVRRAAVAGSALRPSFSLAGNSRPLSGAAFQLEPPEDTVWPNEKPDAGVSYELNWSICGSGVVPLGKAFRNLRLPELMAAGGSSDTSTPEEVAFGSVEKEVKSALGDSSTTLYVQDCALGTVLGNEVPVRIVTDNAAAAASFKTLCAAARTVPLPEYEEDVTVLLSSAASSPYIASNKGKKMVLMGGSFNAGALIKHIEAISSDAFLARGVLPMFGSGADNVVYLGPGFESGAVVQHGFSFSGAGFCRLYAGSAAADGSVAPAGSLPNSLPMPKAVVMFANDATGAIPAASVLDAAQVPAVPPLAIVLEPLNRCYATWLQQRSWHIPCKPCAIMGSREDRLWQRCAGWCPVRVVKTAAFSWSDKCCVWCRRPSTTSAPARLQG